MIVQYNGREQTMTPTSTPLRERSATRLLFIDNLRWSMIILVISMRRCLNWHQEIFPGDPNMRGSKKNGEIFLTSTDPNCRRRGLSKSLPSNGITTDGTESMRIFPSKSQSVPSWRD